MKQGKLNIGSVVQLNPNLDRFGACLMVVSEPKDFGAQGYVTIPGRQTATVYYRAKWEDMEYVGESTWVNSDAGQEPGEK